MKVKVLNTKMWTYFNLLLVTGMSVDCPNVINFALGMNMDKVQPYYFGILNSSDCCSYSNPRNGDHYNQIVCDSNNRVTDIKLTRLGLNGTINEKALPNSLLSLLVYSNELTGSIPSVLPPNLSVLDIDGNNLGGDLPTMPDSLQYIYLGGVGYTGCHFTGTLRMNKPIIIHIYANWITDIVISDFSSMYWPECVISNNPLLDSPHLAAFARCPVKDGLYSASLLPNSLTRILPRATSKSTVSISSSSLNATLPLATDSADLPREQNTENLQLDYKSPVLIYALLGGIVALCILVLLASILFRNPKMHSKFGRKNSFGTLNTVNTTMTAKTTRTF